MVLFNAHLTQSQSIKNLFINQHTKNQFDSNRLIELKKIDQHDIHLKTVFTKATIILNVGGCKHEISWSKLEKCAPSRLYRIRFAENIDELEQLCDGYDTMHNELFFDRPAKHFASILHFYQVMISR